MCSVYYHYTSGWAILHILFLLTGNASWYSAASFLSFQSIWQEEDVTPVGQCSQCFVVSLGCGGGGGGDAQLWWWIDAFHYWLGSSHMSATYKSMAIIRKPRPSLSLMFSIAVIKYNIWHLFITCQYSNPMIWHSFHLILVMTVILHIFVVWLPMPLVWACLVKAVYFFVIFRHCIPQLFQGWLVTGNMFPLKLSWCFCTHLPLHSQECTNHVISCTIQTPHDIWKCAEMMEYLWAALFLHSHTSH